VLDLVRSAVSDNSKQLHFLANENDKWMNVEQNVKVDEARSTSVLEPCAEDLSTVAPYFQPSFNFAAYVNNSPTLQELVKLGVDLHSLERKKDVPEFILRLEFNRDMKEHIR
jgi:mTERF domain-containing protein